MRLVGRAREKRDRLEYTGGLRASRDYYVKDEDERRLAFIQTGQKIQF